jgi:hypothetical protein
MRFLGFSLRTICLAELGARESIPYNNILHPRSSHCVPEELRVEAIRQGAIDGGGEVM